MKKEIWADIYDYEGIYQISSWGRVKNIKRNRLLVPYMNPVTGYFHVNLSKDGKARTSYIHRLVALAFLPDYLFYDEVNHIDEDKSNNRVDNLEWCTIKYNRSFGTRGKRIVETKAKRKK